MRTLIYRTVFASTILCQSMALVFASTTVGSAQTQPPQQSERSTADEDADAASSQLALTDKQVGQLIAAQKAISGIVEKIPEDQTDEPNPQIQAALDKTAKHYGFKDYGEYDDVANNVTYLLEGFDREKKAFVGHEAVLKKQIADIGADDRLQPREKREQIKQLKDTLKTIEPVKYPDNIALVTKYYDQLSELFNDEQ
jgi:hypothetical protein